MRIGELSLGEGFNRVLRWGFDRMLWMNPVDNQGIRFLLPAVRAGRRREESAS